MQKKHCCLAIGIILIGYYYLVRKKKNSNKKNRKNSFEASTSKTIEQIDPITEKKVDIRNTISIKADINVNQDKNIDSTLNESFVRLNKKSIELLTNSLTDLSINKDIDLIDTKLDVVNLENCDSNSFNSETHVTEFNIILETPKLNKSAVESTSESPVIEDQISKHETLPIDLSINNTSNCEIEENNSVNIDNSILDKKQELIYENKEYQDEVKIVDIVNNVKEMRDTSIKTEDSKLTENSELMNKSDPESDVAGDDVKLKTKPIPTQSQEEQQVSDSVITDISPVSKVHGEISDEISVEVNTEVVTKNSAQDSSVCSTGVPEAESDLACKLSQHSNNINTLNDASNQLNIDILSNSSKENLMDTISDVGYL